MKDKDILLIAIATLITAFSWLAFDAYHAYSNSSLPPEVIKAAIPITPEIDTAAIDKIKKRQLPIVPVVISESKVSQIVIATTGGKKR